MTAIPSRHFCGDYKQVTTSKLDCENLEKFVCFTCPLRDHFSSDCDKCDCDNCTRESSPCLRKKPIPREEVETQLLDWQDRCNDTLCLLRACDRGDAANALELQRPELRGCKEPSDQEHIHENEKVANIFSDQLLVTLDSSRRLTRRKQHFDAMKEYCLAIFQTLEAFGFAEPWTLSAAGTSTQISHERGGKPESVIPYPTTALIIPGSMANFVDLMHARITKLYEMPGDTLYSQYTVAFRIIQSAIRWKFTSTGFTLNNVHSSRISAAEITRLFRPLDTQLKDILEGLMRTGGLPWDQALCFLETHCVTHLYVSSWKFLRELFHYEDGGLAP